ncbi:hypothetical protein AB0C24_13640 [Amycolatopsis japonica]|uniref:hypothetical protein n=1 Tax=Amycolatopsis japonica TaxID=208439 RepID=UPI0033E84FBD
MIPFVGTDVFWLDRPHIYDADLVQGAMVLLFRALMVAPALAYIAFLFRSQDEIVIYRYRPAGPVERAVVAAMLSRQRLALDKRGEAFRLAAAALNRNGPASPTPSTNWAPSTVRTALIAEQESARRNRR